MTTLRRKLARHNALVRIAVVLVAVNYLLPIQLVWCNETNSDPKVEFAFNGQCLASSSHDCCDGDNFVDDNAGPSEPVQLASNPIGAHNHCVQCSDELLQVKHVAQLDFMQRLIPGGSVGGCLFSLPSIDCLQLGTLQKPGLPTVRLWTATPNSLHALSTSLII